jgi:DNA-binding NtrC family response regulator
MREKPADILLLAQYFLEKLNRLHHSHLEGFSPEADTCLQSYPWPGNVRELENLIARLAILKGEGEIRQADLPAALQGPALHALGLQTAALPTAGAINFREEVDRFEHQLLLQALQQSNWNKNKAAELLKINRTTLVEKLKRKKISRPVAAPTLPFPPPRLVNPSSNS